MDAVQSLEAIRPELADGSVCGLSDRQIARRLKAACEAAGLSGRFGGHSCRVGMAQDLSAHGAALPELMQAGRWTSAAMPARYTRAQSAARSAVAKYHRR